MRDAALQFRHEKGQSAREYYPTIPDPPTAGGLGDPRLRRGCWESEPSPKQMKMLDSCFLENLIRIHECDTMCHMRTITIRELHQETGRWVRQASSGEVLVTERGNLIAKIVPAARPPSQPFFASPRYTRAFLRYRTSLRGGTDATEIVSQERDREAE